ncbi:MAG TPA: hypothetical protein VIM61_11645 [Chthoniobacterales bacterium]|jgi:hypothetical protein
MKFPAALLAAFAAALVSASASELDFTLVNKTGHSIDALYLSASADKDWNENLLPNGTTLAEGAKAAVKFEAKPNDADWDIRAVDDDGTVFTFEKINLIDAKTVTLEVTATATSAVVE